MKSLRCGIIVATLFSILLFACGDICAVTHPEPPSVVLSAFNSLPSHGDAALIIPEGKGLIAVAVGRGRYLPKPAYLAPTDVTIQKLKAVRAAVVSAKQALADQCQQGVATQSEEKKSDDKESFHENVSVSTERMILSRSFLWKSEVNQEEGGYSARAWIYFLTDATEGVQDQTGGLPSFMTPQEAAEQISQWAGKGLCDDGELRLPIGQPGHERLVAFGVGLASPSASSNVLARQKAVASLLRASGSASESIEGTKTLDRVDMPDPLGKEGASSILRESFFQRMLNEHDGIIHPTATPFFKTLPDGLTCCVVWNES
jgi:hypothetical protein